MGFSFSIAGEQVIAIDDPAKASRVANGVEEWLLKKGARDLRRFPDRIEFKGNPIWMSGIGRLRKNRHASIWLAPELRGITVRTVQFDNHPDKVMMRFALSFSPFQLPLWLPIILIAAQLARISFVLAVVLVFGGGALATYLWQRLTGPAFKSDLYRAAIRGLADGAVRELAELRAR